MLTHNEDAKFAEPRSNVRGFDPRAPKDASDAEFLEHLKATRLRAEASAKRRKKKK